jgi:hypothetical protein
LEVDAKPLIPIPVGGVTLMDVAPDRFDPVMVRFTKSPGTAEPGLIPVIDGPDPEPDSSVARILEPGPYMYSLPRLSVPCGLGEVTGVTEPGANQRALAATTIVVAAATSITNTTTAIFFSLASASP